MASIFTSLSPEILHEICLNVEPTDLASLAQTCHHLHGFVRRDDLLWKLQYLDRLDGPSPSQELAPESWQDRLKDVVSLQKILESDDRDLKNESETLERVSRLVYDLMTASTADPINNIQFLTNLFAQESNTSALLCKSSLFRHARYPSDQPACTEALRQLSAKLHVFYGLEVEPSSEALCESAGRFNESSPQLVRQVHPFARSRVYDLRRYRTSNLWGPFMDDGSLRVDWEKVQAVMIDLCYNLRMYTARRRPSSSQSSASNASDTPPPASTSTGTSASSTPSTTSSSSSSIPSSNNLWDQPFQGLAPYSYHSQPLRGKIAPPLNPALDALDPYGVTGTWMRIVCFLDYNNLYAFNFESGWIPLSEERGPIETPEAFRLIRLQLHVTDVRMPSDDESYWDFGAGVGGSGIGTKEGREILRRAEAGEADADADADADKGDGKEKGRASWRDMPIVSFEGRSRSTYMSWDPNANSRIRGTVRLTPHNNIHWTTHSVFHGEERWRSEGVQIGGRRSARGVLGNWFDKDFDVHGPAGPTAFWKVSDDVLEEKPVVAGAGWVWGGGGGHEALLSLLLGAGGGGGAGGLGNVVTFGGGEEDG